MSKPINIPVASDTREFQAGIKKGVIEPLKDAVSSLDDVQREGDKAGDRLEGAFEKAQREISDFKREQSDAAKKTSRDWKDTGDDVGRVMKAGTDRAKEGVDEIGREAASTAKESAASFDGSAESIGDAFQEIAANAFAGFGPAGLLAGVAAAAGIGTVFAAIERGNEETEAWKERVGELADEFIETGGVGEASVQGIVDRLRDLATTTEDVNLEKLADVARRSRGDFRDLAEAYAGNSEGLDDLIDKTDETIRALEDEATAVDTTTDAGVRRYQQIQEQLGGLGQQADYLYKARDATQAAAEAEANWLASGGPEMQLKADLIGAVDQAYDNAAGATENFVSKETGLFDVGAYIASMTERSDALRNYQTDILSSGLTPEAIAFLNEQGVESASQMLAGYKSAAPDQQSELNRIWTEAGKTNSGEYSKALETGIPKTFKGPKITADMDLDAANRELERYVDRVRTVTIKAEVVASGSGKFGIP